MLPDIVATDAPDRSDWEAIHRGLDAFNRERGRPADFCRLALLLRDRGTGDIVGGLWGATYWRWLFVELLFVPEASRGAGLGSELLRRAEEGAVRRGCIGAWLDTFSFQARGFYERQGYAAFGTIGDYPPGHSRFFLKKIFADFPLSRGAGEGPSAPGSP